MASHNYVVQMNRRDAMSAEITAEAKTSAFIAPLRFICLRPTTNSAAWEMSSQFGDTTLETIEAGGLQTGTCMGDRLVRRANSHDRPLDHQAQAWASEAVVGCRLTQPARYCQLPK